MTDITATPAPASTPLSQSTNAGASAARSVKTYVAREEPATLAKMAVAAIAPQLIAMATKFAWRFALRNPVTTIAGLAALAYSYGDRHPPKLKG